MNVFTRQLAALAALTTLVAACGGPLDSTGDEPLVIITTDDGDGTGDPDADPATDPEPEPDPEPDANTDPDPEPDANTDPDPEPEPDPDPDPELEPEPEPEPEPCGNGVIEDGETCDGDCPSSCNDGNSCTTDAMTGSPDTCTAVCANTFDAACTTFDGSYSGSYFVKAEERVGSTVIHSVSCTGTFTVSVDTSAADHVTGTAECDYPGSVGSFESNQSATITGSVSPDGAVELSILHDFGTQRDGRFAIDGTISGGDLVVDDTSSFLPHPMSAVPWEVELRLN